MLRISCLQYFIIKIFENRFTTKWKIQSSRGPKKAAKLYNNKHIHGENCMCGSCLLVSELPPGIKLKIYIWSRKSSINHILFPPIVEM